MADTPTPNPTPNPTAGITPHQDTIVAPATPPGEGAIGVIRISGPAAHEISDRCFLGKTLSAQAGHTAHFGRFVTEAGNELDEVLATVFRAPRSYTREDVVEFSFHGSPYILERAMQTFIAHGARPAQPGEFTQRAFLNGAMDLAQAEAVADLIAARSAGAQQLALAQLRGGVSNKLNALREELLNFASLIELELDFAEEDVDFADLDALAQTVARTRAEIGKLVASFASGNALKQGIPTVIAGKPNAGKSTLLNRLLEDERAIVSDIPGTTRDVIEDRLLLGGYEFRLTDTAGLRDTTDPTEAIGVERSKASLTKAAVVIYLYDATAETHASAQADVQQLELPENVHLLLVANKTDAADTPTAPDTLAISALHDTGLDALKAALVDIALSLDQQETQLTSQRHLHALRAADEHLAALSEGLAVQLTGDLLAIDLRAALQHIGEITGEFTTDEILENIFSKFCIGK